MRILCWLRFGLLGSLTVAFQDASPFIALSTSKFLNITDSHVPEVLVASATSVSAQLRHSLINCDVDANILVSLPGTSDADFVSAQSMFHLRQRMQAVNGAMGTSTMIQNLAGTIDVDNISDYLTTSCKASATTIDTSSTIDKVLRLIDTGSLPLILRINFPRLPEPPEERSSQLRHHDLFLDQLINSLQISTYTVVFSTTPPDTEYQWLQPSGPVSLPEAVYEMDEAYPSVVHMDLKRDISEHAKMDETVSNVGLFERYAFLNPGIFMGILVSILLLSILYIGISAVASLEVSYMAFSKEMGPAAQKKQ